MSGQDSDKSLDKSLNALDLNGSDNDSDSDENGVEDQLKELKKLALELASKKADATTTKKVGRILHHALQELKTLKAAQAKAAKAAAAKAKASKADKTKSAEKKDGKKDTKKDKKKSTTRTTAKTSAAKGDKDDEDSGHDEMDVSMQQAQALIDQVKAEKRSEAEITMDQIRAKREARNRGMNRSLNLSFTSAQNASAGALNFSTSALSHDEMNDLERLNALRKKREKRRAKMKASGPGTLKRNNTCG